MATPSGPLSAARVRHATEADGAELARLRWECTVESGQRTEPFEAFADRFRDFVRRALLSGRWAIWVAELEGRLVGNVWVGLVDRVPGPNGDTPVWAHVTNVYVDPELRNHGLGTMLLDAAIEWSRYVGAETLIAWRSGARVSFYERRRFARSAEAMELRFGE
ncbi:MAG: GNAT family N-acetyltransferase [Actinomycetota bacterium]|nr:GNAT family N-acetyltransferase [Actinomycetota bacterium]